MIGRTQLADLTEQSMSRYLDDCRAKIAQIEVEISEKKEQLRHLKQHLHFAERRAKKK